MTFESLADFLESTKIGGEIFEFNIFGHPLELESS